MTQLNSTAASSPLSPRYSGGSGAGGEGGQRTRQYIGFALAILLAVGAALAHPAAALAQPAPAVADLLRRVPDDMGICLAFNDVKGFTERLGKTTWFPKLQENPLVKHVLAGKEIGDLVRFEDELKKHLQIDFASLRDDILGDAVVFAYQPAADGKAKGDAERGLLLVKAPKAEALSGLIERINELQTNAGELTSLEERKHKDHVYYRRVHQRATHFYYHRGPFWRSRARRS